MLMLNAAESAATSGVSGLLMVIIPVILFLSVYFIPTFIAIKSKHINKTGIILLNIFLGWSFVGWVIALIWSVMKKNKLGG